MSIHEDQIEIVVADQRIAGTIVAAQNAATGVLFIHGWGGSQQQFMLPAREIAPRGCACLAFDLRGHARTKPQRESITREDNLRDVIAAYETLLRQRDLDPSAIAVIGDSYGGYLAAILSSLNPVRWLALRAPALYKDEDWAVPKHELSAAALADYRCRTVSPDRNRALTACTVFKGDVLLVESEHDSIVPHPVLANYVAAFRNARSLTHRILEGADHGLSSPFLQKAYSSLLVGWVTDMVLHKSVHPAR
jgi:uncharacterized protein